MFDVTILRRTADGDMAEDTHEGVVDLKTFPGLGKVHLEFNDGDSESFPLGAEGTVHVESPLK